MDLLPDVLVSHHGIQEIVGIETGNVVVKNSGLGAELLEAEKVLVLCEYSAKWYRQQSAFQRNQIRRNNILGSLRASSNVVGECGRRFG